MTYITSATERTTGPGNSNETKALFYLMGQDEDRDEIAYFIVDVFNDLAGSDTSAARLWDVQSKNAKSSPKMIGEELVTLFKNYMSDFRPYIMRRLLFLGSVTNTVRNDESLTHFRYSDLKESAQKTVKQGLEDEALRKTYVDNDWVTESNISAFLATVEFVVANGTNASYVKPIIGCAAKEIVTDQKLEAIFNEVRKAQSDKKNILSEGVEMNCPYEAFVLGKHISKKNIEQLTLARLINRDPIAVGVPISFLPVYQGYPADAAEEMLEDCQNAVALQLFDKNAKDAFWALFDCIVEIVIDDKTLSVTEIFERIDSGLIASCVHLNPLATQFFIAQIKDGLK